MTKNKVAEELKLVLADSYALYVKTQNYHWNVEGRRFKELHLLFEEQYTDLAMAIDTIAELIRALGIKAPGNLDIYSKTTKIKPGDENASEDKMVKELAEDQHVISKTLNAALKVSQKEGDEVVSDALITRLSVHRKNAWMLESTLK